MDVKYRRIGWWILTSLLFTLSTIGLIGGFSIGFQMGVEGVSGYTISPGLATLVAIIIGVIFQLWETMVVIEWKEVDQLMLLMGIFMIIIDASALFLAAGGHVNLIWMMENANDSVGMLIHTCGLAIQTAAAILGSFGAELAFKRAVSTQ